MAAKVFPYTKIDAQFLDYHPNENDASFHFRFWHVETLLNTAADLLDRCLTEQAKYDSLRAQQVIFNTNVRAEEELLKLDELKNKRGIDNYAWADAKEKHEKLEAMRKTMDEVAASLSAANDPHAGRTPSAAAAMHSQEINRARWEMETHFAMLDSRRQSDFGAIDDEKPGNLLGLLALKKYALSQSRVRLEDKKNNTRNDMPLDFKAQAVRSAGRIERDYRFAIERLLVASDGLSRIYGYEENFKPQLPVETGVKTIIDTAADWVKNAIHWLARFSQKDQTFTVTLSVRRALKEQWTKIYSSNDALYFAIDKNVFDGHAYVRLRGISASSQLKKGVNEFPICCIVTVPKAARFFDEKGVSVTEKAISQSDMPSCTLGRVSDVSTPREPEVCGAVSLMNASPIGEDGAEGKWSIRLQRIVDAPMKDIEDIFLELRVTGRPRHQK